MNENIIKLVKYGLIFLVIIGLGVAVGLFWSQNKNLKKDIIEFKREVELLDKQHYTDSLKFTKQYDSLNKISKYQDSIIQVKIDGLKWIYAKYDAERKRVKSLNADSTLMFFKEQSEISNNW